MLFEYAQCKQWPKPKPCLLKETGPAHKKHYVIQFSISERKFPVGAGKSKEIAKRRAAARTLSELKGFRMRGNLLF